MTNDTKEAAHSALPWISTYNEEAGEITIWAGTGLEDRQQGCWKDVEEMPLYDCSYEEDNDFKEKVANAEFIVKCVNSHDELVEALKGLLEDIIDYQTINNLGGENNHWQVIAKEALKKVGAL